MRHNGEEVRFDKYTNKYIIASSSFEAYFDQCTVDHLDALFLHRCENGYRFTEMRAISERPHDIYRERSLGEQTYIERGSDQLCERRESHASPSSIVDPLGQRRPPRPRMAVHGGR